MSAALVNSRYVAYAAAHGETPDGMLAADRLRWRGGCMTGFQGWMHERWAEWRKANGRTAPATDADHAAFDAWLAP